MTTQSSKTQIMKKLKNSNFDNLKYDKSWFMKKTTLKWSFSHLDTLTAEMFYGQRFAILAMFSCQVDSISIKGIYPGYKKGFTPPQSTWSFWHFLQVLETFCRGQQIFFLKCPEKKYICTILSPRKGNLPVVLAWTYWPRIIQGISRRIFLAPTKN